MFSRLSRSLTLRLAFLADRHEIAHDADSIPNSVTNIINRTDQSPRRQVCTGICFFFGGGGGGGTQMTDHFKKIGATCGVQNTKKDVTAP